MILFRDVTPTQISVALKPLVDAIKEAAIKGPYDWFVGAVTAISLLLVGVTAVMTRKMQLASEKQANAALEALRESVRQRQIGERMLDEAQKQHLLEIRPVVVVESEITTVGHKLRLRNIGRGPAFHANVSAIREPAASLEFATVQLVQANQTEPMPIMVRSSIVPSPRMIGDDGDSINAIVRLMSMNHLPSTLDLQISYTDLYGHSYTIVMKLAVEKNGRYGLHYIGGTMDTILAAKN